VINIISTAGLKGKVNESVYCASKYAVRGFTESLQEELKDKLDVTAVYMGGMATPFWDQSTHIKDKSRLKSATEVAKYIFKHDDGRRVIEVK
jgi:short-subunit dehydrogenase